MHAYAHCSGMLITVRLSLIHYKLNSCIAFPVSESLIQKYLRNLTWNAGIWTIWWNSANSTFMLISSAIFKTFFDAFISIKKLNALQPTLWICQQTDSFDKKPNNPKMSSFIFNLIVLRSDSNSCAILIFRSYCVQNAAQSSALLFVQLSYEI